MPSHCPGFTDNPFKTRADFIKAGVALVKPLEVYRSPGKARIKLPTATGTHFSEHSAQLEGFARPFWLLANLFDDTSLDQELDLEGWITGLKAGVDPASPEYWGDVGPYDQRMVEMESIAYALLLSPKPLILALEEDPSAKSNLIAWFKQMQGKPMPPNNWRWFRVFVNLALTRVLGVPLAEVQESIDRDFELMDSFYLGDGWNSDGVWSAERKQADYYSGSFAIQFAQLLYVRLAPDFDPARTQRYVEQAKQFATSFWRYFSSQGAAIPFGRSLTYRFAFAAFWAACAQAEVQLPAPLDHPGAVKGMLLRHLRWWSRRPEMFSVDGSLSIGFTYLANKTPDPNLYMSEDYNSPQSVYWCLKSFIAVGLSESHPFWTSEEGQYPLEKSRDLECVKLVKQPRHILCNSPQHHFLLSAGQYSDADHKGEESKYGKLAYSSAFGLSVAVAGRSLKTSAPDSTLSLSHDNGKTWRVLWEPYDLQVGSFTLGEETVPTLSSTYKPFDHLDLQVITTLIPPVRKYPGWHLRAHKICCAPSVFSTGALNQLHLVDSGFSASGVSTHGAHLSEKTCQESEDGKALASQLEAGTEGWWRSGQSSFIHSESGASGVLDLTKLGESHSSNVETQGEALKPHANTNIMMQRTLIPYIARTIQFANGGLSHADDDTVFSFMTGIFAIDAAARCSPQETLAFWRGMDKDHLIDLEI